MQIIQSMRHSKIIKLLLSALIIIHFFESNKILRINNLKFIVSLNKRNCELKFYIASTEYKIIYRRC